LDPSKESFVDNELMSVWTDKSGNKNHAVQSVDANKPRYKTNSINGRSVVRFSGNQFLSITANLLGANNPVTAFVVYRWISGNYAGFLSNRRGDQNSPLLGIDTWQKPLPTIYAQAGHFGGNAINGPQLNNEAAMISYVRNPTTHRLFMNSTAYSSGPVGDFYTQSIAPTRIGSYRANDVSIHLLNSDLAEIILYNTNLNDAQRIIIENYLSAKYNLPIANKYYTDNTHYNQDVQGIGTTNGTVKHGQAAHGKGLILTEANNSLNGPAAEFLFAGHNAATNAWVTTDLPAAAALERWQRSWYVHKTGTVEARLAFDWSEGGLAAGELSGDFQTYVLLYRPDLQSPFAAVTRNGAPLAASPENGDQLSFGLGDGELKNGYYTVGKLAPHVWTGNVSSDWHTAGNWSGNRVPPSTGRAVIPACSTCPVLTTDVAVGALRVEGGGLTLDSHSVTVGGEVSIISTRLFSRQGTIQAEEFTELKGSTFEGHVTLRKTGGGNNAWYGGNTFRGKLLVHNQSTATISTAVQSEDVFIQ
jgi:hypothetical protein